MTVFVIHMEIWKEYEARYTDGSTKMITYEVSMVGDVYSTRKAAEDALLADGFGHASIEWFDCDYERKARVKESLKWDEADIVEREIK